MAIMTRDNAKDYVKNQLESYLKTKGIDTSKNFKCLNPDHNDKHPSMGYKDGRVKCFSCDASYDIFDLIGFDYGIMDNKHIFKKAYDYFGIEIEEEHPKNKGVGAVEFPKHATGTEITPTNKNALKDEYEPQKLIDYKEYLINSINSLKTSPEAQDYLKGRGISMDTANRFNLGYDAEWKHPTPKEPEKKIYPSQRIILPANINSYTARAISESSVKAFKVGGSNLFNVQALYIGEPVIITEGEFDALSVEEIGGHAVALGSINNKNKLIKQLERKTTTAPYLILSLDNDKAGESATQEIAEALGNMGIPYVIANISGDNKDGNEALKRDRKSFKRAVEEVSKGFEDAKLFLLRKEIEKEAAGNHLSAFIEKIKTNKIEKPVSTGFKKLDYILDGGLYGDSLYFIGSISSLGKTTLALQIADNIAKQGETVLIYSLEMARAELMAKSISRLSFEGSGGDPIASANTRQVMTANYETIKTKTDVIYLTEAEQKMKRENIVSSINDYSQYAGNIHIHEGVGNVTIQDIKKTVEKHVRAGIKPYLFIDYMQIIAATNDKKTDKQTLDETVMLLKQMAREYKIAIVGVSSFNRESYSNPVTMSSFKESGAIEYSSDVLMGLQIEGIEAFSKLSDKDKKTSDFDIDNLKSQYPRRIELKILKNRNGITGEKLNFQLYAPYNYFKEKDNDRELVKTDQGSYLNKKR